MLTGRLTLGYDAALCRVISIVGCRGYQNKQNTTETGDKEAGRSNWGRSERAIEELTIFKKHEAHEQRGVTIQSPSASRMDRLTPPVSPHSCSIGPQERAGGGLTWPRPRFFLLLPVQPSLDSRATDACASSFHSSSPSIEKPRHDMIRAFVSI